MLAEKRILPVEAHKWMLLSVRRLGSSLNSGSTLFRILSRRLLKVLSSFYSVQELCTQKIQQMSMKTSHPLIHSGSWGHEWELRVCFVEWLWLIVMAAPHARVPVFKSQLNLALQHSGRQQVINLKYLGSCSQRGSTGLVPATEHFECASANGRHPLLPIVSVCGIYPCTSNKF